MASRLKTPPSNIPKIKRYSQVSTIVTSGILLITIAKKIGWRRYRLAAFLLMGETECFTIGANKQYFYCVSKAYFGYVVKAMEEKGYLARNGRVASGIVYTLTPAGRTFYDKLYKAMRRYYRANFDGHKHKSRI
jgi:hypothetical protein